MKRSTASAPPRRTAGGRAEVHPAQRPGPVHGRLGGRLDASSTANSSSSVRTISTRASGAWITGSGRPVTVAPSAVTGLNATVPMASPEAKASINSAGPSPVTSASRASACCSTGAGAT